MKRILLSLLISGIALTTAYAGDTARVLFIGNSFTAGLPDVLEDLAAANGDVLISINPQISGGQTLQGYSANAATLAAIDAGGYDYMVLQEQSQIPAFPDAQVAQDFYPFAKALVDRMRLKAPCAKPMFYMTWGYRNGDAINCPSFSAICTYKGMDSLLRRRYMNASDSNNALLTPASATWRVIRNTYPHINLYAPDDQHPSAAGIYANACSFYATIFRKSPVGISYSSSLNAMDAGWIQGVAKAVVFDSLNYWRQWWAPTAPADAQFSASVNGWNVQFSSNSVNAAKHNWYFGDGSQDTARNPTHTYTTGQAYAVRLIVESACGERDTIDKAVFLAAASVGGGQNISKLPELYPSPASTQLQLSGLGGRYKSMRITDISGRTVSEQSFPAGADNYTLPVSGLRAGVYLSVLVTHSGERVTLKWVKR